MTESTPQIDFTRIEFPSDRLTIKMLRTAWPEGFDVDMPKGIGAYSEERAHEYDRRSLDDFLGTGIIDAERRLAERAFKMARGQSVDEDRRLKKKDELVGFLSEEYKTSGLARGEHEAAAMLRRIEVQAEAQAREYPGRPR